MPEDATVTAADIARLAGVGRAAVSNWRRRHPDFPRPVEANAVRVVDVDSDGRQDVLLFTPGGVSQYRWVDGAFQRRSLVPLKNQFEPLSATMKP